MSKPAGDWYCENCGYLSSSRVTYSETCDTCHIPVHWHEAGAIDEKDLINQLDTLIFFENENNTTSMVIAKKVYDWMRPYLIRNLMEGVQDMMIDSLREVTAMLESFLEPYHAREKQAVDRANDILSGFQEGQENEAR